VGELTILVSGMIAGVPHHGGTTWVVLQYLLGFKQLGHNVYFVEPVQRDSLQSGGSTLESSVNAAYFRQVMGEFGMHRHSALVLADSRETVGLPYTELRDVAQHADVLINISGLLTDESLLEPVPVRAYLDIDPGFTQLWAAAEGIDMGFASHTHFVTIGLDIGGPECLIPTCGRDWITTLQPIVLAQWPVANSTAYDGLTTVANWRGYGSIVYQGTFYGQKAHSLRQYITLPTLTDEKFLLALAIHPDEKKDLAALTANGWHLLDPAKLADGPASYRRFIQTSKAEFGFAKSGYVAADCGWFSDRSICYLASGRPVVAQSTGFERFLPIGEGLFAFETTDDVLASIDALNSNYPRHREAARSIAEEYFDSDQVLATLLQRLGTTA
jgi:hypothetical protein